MDLQRIDRLALLESDANNQEVWHHSGGQYELMHYALP
jgi:hypothetical protein